MFYETKTTSGETGNYVNRIWLAKWDYETTIREVMPSTNVCILIQLDNNTKYKAIDKEFLKNTPIEFNDWYKRVTDEAISVGNYIIIGPHRDLVLEISQNNTYTIGLEFPTGHSGNFFGIPIKSLSNNILPMDSANDLLCSIVKNINTENNETIFSSTLEYIEKNIINSPYTNVRDQKLMDCIKAIKNNPFIQNVNDLAERYCTSRRNFNRIINEYTGLSAQQYIMIERVNKMTSLIFEHPEYSLNDIIEMCNYQDQSHLNRDTKLIGGLTATTIYQNLHDRISYTPSPLAMNVMEGKYCGLHLH